MCRLLEIQNRIINSSIKLEVADMSKVNASLGSLDEFAKVIFAVSSHAEDSLSSTKT